MIVNVFALEGVELEGVEIVCVTLYSGCVTLLIVTCVVPAAKPWLPDVVTKAVVPLRTMELIAIVVEAPNVFAEMPLFDTAKALVASAKSTLQLLSLGQ